MARATTMPAITDLGGRLNAALLAQGRMAATTDATGVVDRTMLGATLQAIGMALEVGGPDGAGCSTAAISRPGADADHQGRPLAASARSVSRTSAIVEAAITALSDPPAGAA